MSALTVRHEGDWLNVYDENGMKVGSSIAGFGPHAPAAVDIVAALLSAVSQGKHEALGPSFVEAGWREAQRLGLTSDLYKANITSALFEIWQHGSVDGGHRRLKNLGLNDAMIDAILGHAYAAESQAREDDDRG